MGQTPKLEAVIEAAIDNRMEYFYTALPAKVKSFDRAKQRVTIEIQVVNSSEDSAGVTTALFPTIQNVPVMFQGAGNHRITYPIPKGSTGLYIVSTLPTDKWLKYGLRVELNESTQSMNNMAYGYFLPGFQPTGPAIEGITPVASEDEMILHSQKILLGQNAVFSVALERDLRQLKLQLRAVLNALLPPTGGDAFMTALDLLASSSSAGDASGAWPACADKVKAE